MANVLFLIQQETFSKIYTHFPPFVTIKYFLICMCLLLYQRGSVKQFNMAVLPLDNNQDLDLFVNPPKLKSFSAIFTQH